MERNWDKIRELLALVATLDNCKRAITPDEGNWEEAEHMALLIEAGYCTGPLQRFENGYPHVALCRLTWEGYDLLDSIRDDGVWGKVKQNMTAVGGKISVEVLKMLATYYLKQAVGLS